MNIQISRWGNSLALRIPHEILKEAHLGEGDCVSASLASDGSITLRAKRVDRKSLLKELHDLRESMPLSKSIIKQLRDSTRY
jgi:antitoxin MazE